MPIVAERRIYISDDMYLHFIPEINFPTYLAHYTSADMQEIASWMYVCTHEASETTHFRANDWNHKSISERAIGLPIATRRPDFGKLGLTSAGVLQEIATQGEID